MRCSHLRTVVLLSLSLLALGGCGGAMGGRTMVLREGSEGIAVVGEGESDARPDRARFDVGVEVRRPSVTEAREAGAAAQTRVMEALRAAGVSDEDVQTGQLAIQPEYEYTQAGQRLLGYSARNSVTVRVSALDHLAEIVDSAVRAGGDDVRLSGMRFELTDPEAARARAREQAMARARRTAEQLARLAGVELGEPIAIDEQRSESQPPVPMMMARAEAAADTATPIEAGTIEVRVQLQVRYAIR